MNSWHSFSPNGRWMVFSSKARSPYTQMYLTHIDEEGNDTPPILIENATAANRAVNLPEFVNVGPGGMQSLGGPAMDYFRLYDRALYFEKERRYRESAEVWAALQEMVPEDAEVRRHAAVTLRLAGYSHPLGFWMSTVRARPQDVKALRSAAWILATNETLRNGKEALALAERAAKLAPNDLQVLDALAAAYAENGRFEDAVAAIRRGMAADSGLARRLERYQARQPWRE